MKNFYLQNDRVIVELYNGTFTTIYFNSNSGKVYYRNKIDTLTGVKHPGIFLGTDSFGVSYFIHNHYHIGKAAIVTESEFTKGMRIFLYHAKCSNTPIKVIEIALRTVLSGEPYHFLTNNCQTFANAACHNQRKSEDVNNWVEGIFLGSIALLFIAAITGD